MSRTKRRPDPVWIAENEDALARVDGILAKTPEDSSAWRQKGIRHQNLQQMESALRAFDKALSLDASSADAWYAKGSVLAELGDYIEAAQCYREVSRIEPDFDAPPPVCAQMMHVAKQAAKQREKRTRRRSKQRTIRRAVKR